MKTIVIAAAIAVSGLAHANFWDGNMLFKNLNSSSTWEQAAGFGFIIGVADSASGTGHCPPPTSTGLQHEDIVKQWLVSNPSLRHYSADIIVGFALQQAWPCAAKKPTGNKYPL
jgi:hypothetical protein